jgi:hypothetical protein
VKPYYRKAKALIG